MLIAVISDSHNNDRAINEVKNYIKNADVLLFLGDGESDIAKITEGFKGEVYSVSGNCDFLGKSPNERIIELDGIKIFMCHGHAYNVKFGYDNIYYRGLSLGVDIVLFGHSHIPIVEKHNDICLMNPGSISHGACMAKRSLGYIEIKEGKIAQIYTKEIKNR
ncbi:metallophosphoesterase [Clostridium disporicum]|jgi:putative phosphoesterase|uniref:Phosphoesterase n=1 Tax=Clostridium disporicum TaxID=84024 RepID=A0A174HJA5_9CLOT|nr:metallophosphoesterase [Clostridium disporicum]CUO74983.1 phosphodiesterase%2C family [Clostridium disporicum]